MRHIFVFFCFTLAIAGNAMAWMMDAEGFGETPEKAKLAAYATLAGQIRSEIKSETNMSTEVSNQQVNKNASLIQSQKSNLLLKGVTYQEVRQAKDGFKTVAIFDQDALMQTLAYYNTQTVFDPFGVSVSRAQDIKESLLMWRALLLLDQSGSSSAGYQQTLNQRLELVNARLENALLRVHSSAADSQLQVNGQSKSLDQLMILGEGNHQITISAPKFKTLSKIVFLSKGSATSLSENLVPMANVVRRMSITVESELSQYFSQTELKQIMQDVDWQFSATSPLSFSVTGSSRNRLSGSFAQYDFDLNVGVYDGERRLKTVSFKKTVTVNSSANSQLVASKILPEIKKAIVLLANNIEWPSN